MYGAQLQIALDTSLRLRGTCVWPIIPYPLYVYILLFLGGGNRDLDMDKTWTGAWQLSDGMCLIFLFC